MIEPILPPCTGHGDGARCVGRHATRYVVWAGQCVGLIPTHVVGDAGLRAWLWVWVVGMTTLIYLIDAHGCGGVHTLNAFNVCNSA